MKAVLFDLDGVIYTGNEIIPGAKETINWLRKENIPHMFLTNTTSKTPKEVIKKLSGLGIEISEDEIWTPIKAALRWFKDQRVFGPVGLFVKKAIKDEFTETESTEDAIPGLRAVVIGDMVDEWSIERLNHALRMLLKAPDSTLVALGMTRYYKAQEGYRLDVGSVVNMLQFATGKEPVVLGKPSPEFFQTALEILKADAKDTIMIGDDILSDVDGAQKVGLKGILVKTGKFRESDLISGIEPHAVIDSIADFPIWFEKYSV